MLARRSVVALESMIQEGEAIMRYRRDLIEQHKKRVEDGRVQIGGHDVKIVECTCREIVGDLLNEMAVGEPFVASYYMQAERMVFSLRSEEGAVDVSEVAEVYGGGGHVNSAGFTIPRAGLKVI
jgi:nanoRNase/pAp phosphatase (c-di-AMP/oligoRNAs hydrolase)